jgi:hypothetical protein
VLDHAIEEIACFNSTVDTIKRQRKEEEERRRKGFNSTMDTIKPLRKHQSYQAL